MRLKQTRNRIWKGKVYNRWLIDVPPARVKEMGWRSGEELTCRKKGRVLMVWSVKSRRGRSK